VGVNYGLLSSKATSVSTSEHHRWANYRLAKLDISVDAGLIRVERSDDRIGPFPFPTDTRVHVITACNPGHDLAEDENLARQNAFEADLSSRHITWLHAWGGDVDGARLNIEKSAAVVGLTDADAVRLGTAHGQDAIFAWDTMSLSILPCDGAGAQVSPWIARWVGDQRRDGAATACESCSRETGRPHGAGE
jgi:hypothetical protein